VSFVVGAVLACAPAQYWKEIGSISASEGTGQSRILFWKAAVKMFVDHPIVGVGAGNGGIWMSSYVNVTGGRNVQTLWGTTFHGTMPQILAELGSLGTFFYLSMMFLALKYSSRIRKRSDDSEDRLIHFVIIMDNKIPEFYRRLSRGWDNCVFRKRHLSLHRLLSTTLDPLYYHIGSNS
jgi:O-antigen ligase